MGVVEVEVTGGFSTTGAKVMASVDVDVSSSSSNHASSSSSSCRGSLRKRPASILPYRMPWLGREEEQVDRSIISHYRFFSDMILILCANESMTEWQYEYKVKAQREEEEA